LENNASMKGYAVVTCLFLAGLTGSAQRNSTPEPQNPSTRTLYWNEKPDMKKWLTENEPVLRRGDACTLTFSWRSEEDPSGPGSAVHALATYVALPTDEESTSVIHDPQSGLDVRVGIRYVPGGPKSSYLLQLALAFEGPANGVFDEVSRAQAETLRYPAWKSLSVVKAISVNKTRYTFSQGCRNGRDYLATCQRMYSQHHAKSPK
jgi:hypothetical protein